MNNLFLLTLFGCFFLLLLLIIWVAAYRYYRKMLKEKEHEIIHHIRLHDHLEKELQYIHIEKQIMEKLLQSKLDALWMISGTEKSEKKKRKDKK